MERGNQQIYNTKNGQYHNDNTQAEGHVRIISSPIQGNRQGEQVAQTEQAQAEIAAR